MKAAPMASTARPRQATLYRMVMDQHVCPYGLKAKDLLRRQGFTVVDKWLTSREATDAFKAEHGVTTTPQTFIGGELIGPASRCAGCLVWYGMMCSRQRGARRSRSSTAHLARGRVFL